MLSKVDTLESMKKFCVLWMMVVRCVQLSVFQVSRGFCLLMNYFVVIDVMRASARRDNGLCTTETQNPISYFQQSVHYNSVQSESTNIFLLFIIFKFGRCKMKNTSGPHHYNAHTRRDENISSAQIDNTAFIIFIMVHSSKIEFSFRFDTFSQKNL